MDDCVDDNGTEQMRLLYNGLNHKFNEFKDIFQQMVFENSHLKDENRKLKEEKTELLAELQLKNSEVEVLQTEILTLSEDRENMRKELREVRNENDLIISRLNKSDSVMETAMEFAKRLLQANPNANGIVNSLPAFSEQMVLRERPNSMTAFGSLVDMGGSRLRASESKEETYHSVKLASGHTSNETYYDAIASHRSSLTNGSTGVRPKIQQNQVSSTVCAPTPMTVNEVLNETMLTDSTNFYIDDNNNLRLKLIKVPIGRLMTVTMAFSTSPSDFWLHVNPMDVNNFIHVIQVKQNELKNQPNKGLTAADIELGMYCAAIYSSDGYWYRAQIIGITYDHPIERDSVKSVHVLFIDWGNSEERSLSQVMKLSLDLSERRQAINCYVQGCGHRTKWPLQAIKEFEDLIKDKNLKGTFNKPHKVDEVLNSVVYPIDLMYETENGSYDNLNDVLVIPEVQEEDGEVEGLNNTILVADQSSHLKGQSADTVVCNGVPNGHSNPTLSATHNKCELTPKSLEKSKSNQNCTEHTKGAPQSTNSMPKSMPQLNGYPLSESNLSDNHRIPPPIIPDTMEGLIVETSYLDSPSHMFLQIRDAQVGNAQFEDLEESLNAFYSNYKSNYLTQPNEVKCGSFWANLFDRDNRWYRCRVLSIDKDRALVNYVDWGNNDWVEIKGLMRLTRQFSIYPAMAVKCRLSNVFPIKSEQWSSDSLEYFGELIGNERTPPLTAFIAQKPTNFDFDSFLEVFLWTIDINNEDILVNLQLVLNNYATTDHIEWVKEAERGLREKTPPELMSELIPIINNINVETTVPQSQTPPKADTDLLIDSPLVNGDLPSSLIPISLVPNGDVPQLDKTVVKNLPELPDGYSDDDEWDPIAGDAACELNSYNIRPNDAGIATVGFHPIDRKTCKYFGTTHGCRAKDYCSFLHVDPEKRFSLDDNEEEIFNTEELELEVDAILPFRMTSVVSPYHFYGVLPYGPIDLNKTDTEITDDMPLDKELKELCLLLKRKYSNLKENYNIYPAIGSLVAFKDERTDTYYRGRVIEHNIAEKICTVFCVDLGIEKDVKRCLMYKLTKYFRQFPTLAIECSLTGIRPLDGICWSSQSTDAFHDWLTESLVCAHIMYGKTDDKYYVELIAREEDLEFNISERLVELGFAQSTQTMLAPPPPPTDFDDEIYHSDEE